MHENRPPDFPGTEVGTGLDRLEALSAPWSVARAVTAPELTRELLIQEPGFADMSAYTAVTITSTLTFLFQHTRVWTLLWAESVAGPARFEDSRTVRSGVSIDKTVELARTAGLKLTGEGDLWVVKASAEVSAQWSKLTRSTIRVDTENETKRALEFTVPPGGMDIALWQLESRLTRRLILRPGRHLPEEPLPHWVETAIATPVRSVAILTSITQSVTRMPG